MIRFHCMRHCPCCAVRMTSCLPWYLCNIQSVGACRVAEHTMFVVEYLVNGTKRLTVVHLLTHGGHLWHAGKFGYYLTFCLQWLNLLCANVGLVILAGESLKVSSSLQTLPISSDVASPALLSDPNCFDMKLPVQLAGSETKSQVSSHAAC